VLLGHSSIAMTEWYLGIGINELEDAVRILPIIKGD
jgi:hypothetical protein